MNANRPQFMVKDNGTSFYDIKDWDAEISTLNTALTEEEKNSPYARYYYRDIIMPSHECLKGAEVHNPLPKELALRPEEFVQAMDSDRLKDLRTGYYVFEDGTSFSLTRLLWPGVKDEQLDYFNKNYDPDHDLFYKTWYPGMHFRHYCGGCIEDVGLGAELIRFTGGWDLDGYTGIKNYEIKDPYFAYFNAGAGESWPLHDLFNNPRYAIQANIVFDRPEIDGRENIMAFWQGIKVENGRRVRAIPEGEKISEDHVRTHMNHSAWEYTQIGYLIKKFWDDNH